MLGLRDYQTDGIAALRAAYLRGRRAPILVSPTGSGKSRMCAAIAELTIARDNRVLALAPRIEILGQLVKELATIGIPVRSIQAEHDEGPGDAPVTVASIWTLATPRWRNQLPPADLIVIDECHRALAERSYREVLGAYPSAKLLGLTATPARSDGRGLSEVFDEIVVATTTAELTRRGFLVPCYILPPNGDGKGLALPVVEAYQQHAAGRLAIVFAASIAHAKQLLTEFAEQGISAGLVTGKTPDAERAATMSRFAGDQITVLLNVACFVEGLDVPACSAAIFARKFEHVGPYLQAIGRTLRPAPGKQNSVVLDLVGSSLKHGSAELERTYSLDGKGIRSQPIRDAIRQCTTCGSIALAGREVCGYCGAEYPVRSTIPTSDRRGLRAADGTPLRPAKQMRPRIIDSKHPGHCEKCTRWFPAGTRIWWAAGRPAVHASCPAPTIGANT